MSMLWARRGRASSIIWERKSSLVIFAFISLARNACYGQHFLRGGTGKGFSLVLPKVEEQKRKEVWEVASPQFLLLCDQRRSDLFFFFFGRYGNARSLTYCTTAETPIGLSQVLPKFRFFVSFILFILFFMHCRMTITSILFFSLFLLKHNWHTTLGTFKHLY